VRTGPSRWVTVQPEPEPFPNRWQRRVLLWFVAAIFLTAPLAWMFARRLAGPLGDFATAAERLGRDPSAAPANLGGPAEIGRAARAFNDMQARLKRYIDDRTAMVGAISHDLRTPLARMRFRMERAPPDLRTGMLNDIGQMEEMISAVLVFIRDASEPTVRERVDLRSILECVVDDAALIGGEAVLDPGDPVSVEVDTLSVQRVLSNLVDNALKYGQRAEVRMYTEQGEAIAEVHDAGPGLPPEELERVFLPFYRSQSARTLNTGGIGLGLAVSRSIARAHGGDVRLYKNGGEGLVAQLRLPLADEV
jgi:two-component system OmpR family sensor kinase